MRSELGHAFPIAVSYSRREVLGVASPSSVVCLLCALEYANIAWAVRVCECV